VGHFSPKSLGAGVKDIVIGVIGTATTINMTSFNFAEKWQSNSVYANTIWNFGASIAAIKLDNEFPGAILAPDAAVTVGNSPVDGSVFAASVANNNAEIHIP
jgi:choice-of-anchor A domain-containing protein